MSSLNQTVFYWIFQFAHRNGIVDGAGVFLANYLPYILGLWFLFAVLGEKGWRRRTLFFVEGALSALLARGLVTEVIRHFYVHPRPFDALGISPLIGESGNSFPSGHMTFFFSLAMIFWYFKPKQGIWFAILSAVVGVARIFVGVHWPFDILGGIAIGFLSGAFIRFVLRREFENLSPSPAAAQADSAARS